MPIRDVCLRNSIDLYIKELRKALDLSQEQFARKLGVSYTTVNRWEHKKMVPSPLALKMLDQLEKSLQLPTTI
jgi:DNA-binding transcriptional regulator YiaG